MLTKFITQCMSFFNFTPPDSDIAPSRRTDLDWLRIILFSLVVLHHVGMFYTSNWGWHAKSQFRSEWLESVLLIMEPWRMPAIWLISGIAIRFVLAKVSVLRFISMRTLRLLLPLLFGVLVIVPPQLYIEMTLRGEIDIGYGEFMLAFFQDNHPIFERYTWGIWPHIDVNHLWYLRSLWYYSLYLVCLLPLLNSNMVSRLTNAVATLPSIIIILLSVTPIIALQMIWGQGDWRYPIGFLFLLYGYLLGWHPQLWRKIWDNTRPLAFLFVIATGALIFLYNYLWIDIMKGDDVTLFNKVMIITVYSLTRILGVLLVLSFTSYLSTNVSRRYHYWNDAVYPFYILHQSIIIVLGYQLTKLSLGSIMQPIVLLIGTIVLCIVLYEVIRRIDLLRPCFGLKMQGSYSGGVRQLGYVCGGLLISPLILTLVF